MPIRCRQGDFLKASQGKEFVRGSSIFARLKVHVTFKVKYCHRIFGWDTLREECSRLFYEVAEKQGVVIEEMGFDEDHVHMVWAVRVTHRLDELAKVFKGTTGRKLLALHPFLKKRYFWNSGLWSGVIYADSIGSNYERICHYMRNQKLERATSSIPPVYSDLTRRPER
ncbi:MAG TPA: IS200/IS605 family transposase [archaeon]|nr:IS200/IS605 family transposase [archaeon]